MEMKHKIIALGVVCVIFGMIIAILIGYTSAPEDGSSKAVTPDESIGKFLQDEIKVEKFEEYLDFLAKEPKIAGRDVADKTLVEYMRNKWEEFGFETEVYPYDVLLSYPDKNDPNSVSIVLKNGTEIAKSRSYEKIVDKSDISDKAVSPFNAYSAAGDVEGHLVYVNYGRIHDFIQLSRDLGVDPTGHICIVRYGMIWRGSKVRTAEKFGCTGVIIYSDPIDYTVPWAGVYPDSWFLPGSAVQRGTLYLDGDPLTPEYPAIDTAWRRWENETSLPQIPVTPIGYDDALKYLKRMGGRNAPDDWVGGLNISYKLGPGFAEASEGASKLKLHVRTRNEMAKIHNVMGYIKGQYEPDRYVILGNHRDSWVFGAMDASIGSTALMEIARAMGAAVRNGWKPRRTIVACSWGGEEHGMIGSNEWVEEFQKVLSSRAVAYLNIDTSVQGNYTLFMQANPNLNRLLYESARKVRNFDESEIAEGRTTLYDTWAKRAPKNSDPNSVPKISPLGSGSDYFQFLQITGISSAYIRYYFDTRLNLRYYPLYHTAYDTLRLVKEILDPGFKVNKAVTQYISEVSRRLIDDTIIPLNCEDYAAKLMEDKKTFIDKHGELMRQHGLNLSLFDDAMDELGTITKDFHERIKLLDLTSELKVRTINDQLMLFERAFIDMNGVGGSTNHRHVAFSPSIHDTYASLTFPGLADALFDIEADPDQAGRWREVERQYSILLYHIGSAASTLREVVPIRGHSNM